MGGLCWVWILDVLQCRAVVDARGVGGRQRLVLSFLVVT